MSGYIAGLDLSLTAPGIATADGVLVLNPKSTGTQRLTIVRDWVLDHVGPARIAVMEGYSYASKFSRAHSLGELGGVVKVALVERDVQVEVVEPSTLKQFATSKGNAGKPDMLDAARRAGYEGTNNDNGVDAWWLYQFGLYAFDHTWRGEGGVSEIQALAYRDAVMAKWLSGREAA